MLSERANFPNSFLTTSALPGLLPPSAAGTPTTCSTDMASFGGISGLKLDESDPKARLVMFLAVVFTSNAAPVAPAPSILDLSSTGLGTSFSSLSPPLNQTFCIGDGLIGTGAAQSLVVPDSAMSLYLGVVDSSDVVANPASYANNRGSFSVERVMIPEPSTWALVASGCMIATACRRRF